MGPYKKRIPNTKKIYQAETDEEREKLKDADELDYAGKFRDPRAMANKP